MVLRDRLRRLAREEGRKEGQAEANEAWLMWLRRREEAWSLGKPFDEPNPAEAREQNRGQADQAEKS
jgi:hypothetical protein